MNNVGCLTFFLSKFCIVYGFISQGSLMAALPTLQKESFNISVYLPPFLVKFELKTKKKRFEWDPLATAVIMSAPDLAFMITVVPIEKIIRPMDRGRVLGLRRVFELKLSVLCSQVRLIVHGLNI